MSLIGSGRGKPTLETRLAALDELVVAGADVVDAATLATLRGIRDSAAERRRRSLEHTVVGLFGATGSGKSSLLNALVGAPVATTHVRRPTTTDPLAVLWQPDGASSLLDWLGIDDRHVREQPIDPRATSLILVDLPDFDSVEASHHAIAARLAGQVDAMIWVLDPQKYADAVVHTEFIAPHAAHGSVTLVVLNQADRLAAGDVDDVLRHVRSLVAADGLKPTAVVATSATTGVGVDALARSIGDIAAARGAVLTRIAADLDAVGGTIEPAGTARGFIPAARTALAEAVAASSGVAAVATAVGAAYRRRAAKLGGWPLVSWIHRFRPDPLRRLGLGAGRGAADAQLRHTSLPEPGAAGAARRSIAVRSAVDAASAGLTEPWRALARDAGEQASATLGDEVDRALASTTLPTKAGWWWPIPAIVQWVALAAALVGVGWLLLAAFGAGLPIPRVEIPNIEGWSVPVLLIAGGILLGIVVALGNGAIAAGVGAARRRRTRRALVAAVAAVTDAVVVAPVGAALQRASDFESARRRVSGR